MGRTDDEGDDYQRKSRKKKKRRERSRSSSIGSDTSRQSSSRHKKSKKKHHRSPSPERRRRKRSRSRRRSRSTESHHRRSHSPSRIRGRYSRSRSRDRRSRSRDRRSRSRDRRSRSRDRRSYSRGRSRSRGRRSRSRSQSRTGSQRSSEDRKSDLRKSGTSSPSTTAIRSLSLGDGNDATPAQLAEERMRQALKAAAAADEKLRGHTMSEAAFSSRALDSQNFANKVKEIESDKFVTSSFSSSRGSKAIKEEPSESSLSHDDAIFGSLSTTGFQIKPDPEAAAVDWNTDSLIHPSLFCDVDEKMDRWIERLTQLRKRKIEGEVMDNT